MLQITKHQGDFRKFGLVVPGCRGIRGVGADSSLLDGIPEVEAKGRVCIFNLGDTTAYSAGNSLPRSIRNVSGFPIPAPKPMSIQKLIFEKLDLVS